MTPFDEKARNAAADIVDTWETSGKGYGDLEDRIESALRAAYNEGAVTGLKHAAEMQANRS